MTENNLVGQPGRWNEEAVKQSGNNSHPMAGVVNEHTGRHRKPGVDHNDPHPNEPTPNYEWSADQVLHVAVAYSNPYRFNTRRELFNNFRRHMAGHLNIRLYVGELAYGDRPFEVTDAGNPLDFQFRTRQVLWHKENILNQVIARFPRHWRYGAYVDGDFNFTRHDWGLEIVHQLQMYDWVQPYSSYADLTSDHRQLRVLKSFAYRFCNGELSPPVLAVAARGGYSNSQKGQGVGTTGGAWAFRREAFDACGGLLETCILGSGDWHMAFGLAGEPDIHPQSAELLRCAPSYSESIKVWQTRAARATRKNIGYVDAFAVHHFHGSKQRRGYGTRWLILRDHRFDPYRDLHRDFNGLFQLTDIKPGLRDDIRRYFASRNDDDKALMVGDVVMGGN